MEIFFFFFQTHTTHAAHAAHAYITMPIEEKRVILLQYTIDIQSTGSKVWNPNPPSSSILTCLV